MCKLAQKALLRLISIPARRSAMITCLRNKLICFAVASTALVSASHAAFASSCNYVVVEPIRFAKGAVCWYYAGKATHFKGQFSRGQRVTVEMSGEMWSASCSDPYSSKPSWTGRSPSIEGPHGFFAASDPMEDEAVGRLEATLPEDGTYIFAFSPCAMTNQWGHVAICAGPAK